MGGVRGGLGSRWMEVRGGVTEEGRRGRSESEGRYVDGRGMQVKSSQEEEGAGGDVWNVITMKRYGGESVSLGSDEILRVRFTNVRTYIHTYILQKLLCTDTCSSIKSDLHLANLLINLLHKLQTRGKQVKHNRFMNAPAHPGTACSPMHVNSSR